MMATEIVFVASRLKVLVRLLESPGDRPRTPNLSLHSPTWPPKHWTFWLLESVTRIKPVGGSFC